MECRVWSVKCRVSSVECIVAPATQKNFRHGIQQVEMSQSATPATQNNMTTCLKTFEKERCGTFPIDTARPQENQRLETRHVGAAKRAFRARLPPIFTVGNLRKLPSSFITSHKMLRHAYHGICTLSPPDAALTMRFAKNTQHDKSKVLRLPRQMTMDTSKVLRLPRKLQRVF